MKSIQIFVFAIIATMLSISSCTVDEPEIPNDEEVITTLRYILTPVNGSDAIVFEFQDLDGDGYGSSVVVNECSAPVGYVLTTGDCVDTGFVNGVAAANGQCLHIVEGAFSLTDKIKKM